MKPKVPSFPKFSERFPWIGADLQTTRNQLAGEDADLDAWPMRDIKIDLPDGDQLSARWHLPGEDTGRPTVVAIHGLAGDETSPYLMATTKHLLEVGFPVIRLNMRGAGPSRAHCRSTYHGGRSADLGYFFENLPKETTENGLCAIAYSLGGNILLKYLGEAGRDTPLLGAVSVSAPIVLAESANYFMRPRNRGYQIWLLDKLKRGILPSLEGTPWKQVVLDCRSIPEFDEKFVAPVNGFKNAEDYWQQSSAISFLPKIDVPTLVIHARDDPWIPEKSYDSFDWASNPHLHLLMPDGGGHVGFHSSDHRIPWHDRCAISWFRLWP